MEHTDTMSELEKLRNGLEYSYWDKEINEQKHNALRLTNKLIKWIRQMKQLCLLLLKIYLVLREMIHGLVIILTKHRKNSPSSKQM